MQEETFTLLMRALKGPASACLMALSLVEQPVTARWLSHTTGYAPNTITRALRLLEQLGLATHDGRRSGWRSQYDMQRRSAGQEPGAPAMSVESASPAAEAATQALLDGALPAKAQTEIANCEARDIAPASHLAEECHTQQAVANCDAPASLSAIEPPVADLTGRDVANCDALKSLEDSLRLLKSQTTDSDSGKPSQSGSATGGRDAGNTASGIDPPEIPEERIPLLHVARLLQAASVLFDEPVLVPPGVALDARLALAWIAQAYHQRRKLAKPARVVYAQLKRDEMPSSRYLDDPLSYLPERYLEAAGLRLPPALPGEPPSPEDEPPEEEPAADPPPPEPHPSLSLPVSPGSPISALQAWQQALEVVVQQVPPGSLRQHLKAVEPLHYDPGQGLFTLLAKDAQAQQMLQERLGKMLQRWLLGICQREPLVRFESPPAQRQ